MDKKEVFDEKNKRLKEINDSIDKLIKQKEILKEKINSQKNDENKIIVDEQDKKQNNNNLLK